MPAYREPFLHLLMAHCGLPWIEAWELIGLFSKLAVIIGIPLLVIYWERRPLSSIGVRRLMVRDLLAAMATLLACFYLIDPLVLWVADRAPAMSSQMIAGGAMYASLPKLLDWASLISGGIAEEVGFRGYAIERIEEMTGSTFVGASVPFVVNVLAHTGVWGWYGMLSKAPLLLPLVILYVWRRNLPACALVHILFDVVVFEL